MIDVNITRALVSMGYRKRVSSDKTVWLKPVAHVCFVFTEETGIWQNMFLDVQGNISCWNRHEFKPIEKSGEYVRQLKDFEWDTRVDLGLDGASSFEFADLSEIYKDLM